MKKEEILDETIKTLANAARANAINFFQISFKGENALLLHLLDCGGESTPGKLAEVLHVSAARIAAMLRSLEFKKLIERVCDSADKRRVTVKITDMGKEFVDSVSLEISKRARMLVEKLGEEDARELLRILKKCTGFYESADSGADAAADGKAQIDAMQPIPEEKAVTEDNNG